MEKGLNFRTIKSQIEYFEAYEASLQLFSVPCNEQYISTSFGQSHVICSGDVGNPPLVLLHAASCGSTIWYKNIPFWSKYYSCLLYTSYQCFHRYFKCILSIFPF